MNILSAFLAQGLHLALMLVAAPTLAGLMAAMEARLDGRGGAPVLQVWRDLGRLIRKRSVLAESSSPVTGLAPVVCFATTATAAALVPSFTLGMGLAPAADLLVIVALLGATRMACAFAAMDAGTASGGVIAGRGMRLVLFGEPALLLATFTLALLAGTSNLDLIVALQREGVMQPAAASALVAGALVAVTLTRGQDEIDPELGGTALAVTRFADALGILVWLDLLGVLFLPIGIAEANAGLTAWFVGLAAWLIKLVALAVALAACRRLVGGQRPRSAEELLAIAGLFGLIAAVFALSSASAA